jgi:hypothetical protein
MSPRFHTRGRNQWWKDGRQAGHAMPFERDPGYRLAGRIGIVTSIATLAWFLARGFV